jgi:hypothetical protein
MSKRLVFLFVSLMLAVSLVFTPQAQANSPHLAVNGESYVRVLHAVPGAGAVDVWVDGVKVINHLTFGEITTYLSLADGTHDILVVPAGTTTPELINAQDVPFVSGTAYTIAARLSGTTVVPQIYTDNNTPPASGTAHVRVIHLSPDAPAVDVAPAGGMPVISNLSYPNASPYLPLPGGIYDLEVRPTGSTTVALPIFDVPLESGTIYTVFAMGNLSSLSTLLVADSGNARVRVVHASPDAPGVDVYVDGAKVITNLTYKTVTQYLSVPSGEHRIQVYPTGTMTTAVIDAEVSLMANQDYTVAAVGQLASISPVVFMDNNSAPAPGKASVRFIHLSPDAPAVNVVVAGGGPALFSDIEFKEASSYITVDPGTYDLEVQVASSSAVALAVPDVPLEANKVYTVFAFGLAGGTPALEAALNVDATFYYLFFPIIHSQRTIQPGTMAVP